MALQYYRLDTGYGLEYAADKVQNNAIWAREERSLTLRRTDDLARSKMQLGVTAAFEDKLSGTLRGRLIGNRYPIDTNPIRKINGYFVMDGSFTARDLLVRGLGLSLDIFNVLDLHHSHPGERSANAGETPGYFDAAVVWHGSAGYDSSRLPQPGRAFLLSLRFDV